MLAYQADAEAHGATVALNSRVVSATVSGAAPERLWAACLRACQPP